MDIYVCANCRRQYDNPTPGSKFSCSCGTEMEIPSLERSKPIISPNSTNCGRWRKDFGGSERALEITRNQGHAERLPSLESFDRLVGQPELKTQLISKIVFAFANKTPLPHLLFCGPPKSGKSTLVRLIADAALGVRSQSVSAKELKSLQDTLPFLTNCEEGPSLSSTT